MGKEALMTYNDVSILYLNPTKRIPLKSKKDVYTFIFLEVELEDNLKYGMFKLIVYNNETKEEEFYKKRLKLDEEYVLMEEQDMTNVVKKKIIL